MSAYYNENDPTAAAWLRQLITEGLIADGDVDTRSIAELQPADLRGLTQCHFFAGIGGWSYALRLAGWDDDRPVWTGSCPCQPFSSAGGHAGGDDSRHLWPSWFRLIRECRPDTVFGEQVESAIAHGWLDLVCDDLEREGYAVGAVGLPACSVGAPHIRQRLWFVADTGCPRREHERFDMGSAPDNHPGAGYQRQRLRDDAGDGESTGELADAEDADRRRGERGAETGPRPDGERRWRPAGRGVDSVADAEHAERRPVSQHRDDGRDGEDSGRREAHGELGARGEVYGVAEPGGSVTATGAWADLVWLPCRDGKARPTQPGLQPLAHGVSGRVGRLRGYGNAIVPQVAAEVVTAYMAPRGQSGS